MLATTTLNRSAIRQGLNGVLLVVASCLIASGLLHASIAPQHWQHSPAYGIFHVLAAVGEVAAGLTSAALAAGGLTYTAGEAAEPWLPAPWAKPPSLLEIRNRVDRVAVSRVAPAGSLTRGVEPRRAAQRWVPESKHADPLMPANCCLPLWSHAVAM